MLAPLAKADCLLIREPHAPAAKAVAAALSLSSILKCRLQRTSTCSREIKGLRNTYGTDSVRS